MVIGYNLLTKENLRFLKLFNEKAEKLLQSRFVMFVRNKKRFSVKFDMKKGKGVTIEKELPDQNAIDEFVLTFRFFIQDNEKTSFRNMVKIYEELPISEGLKEKFSILRKQLNDYLDSEPQTRFKIIKETLHRREIMEIFIYGNLAHANLNKKEIYDKWKEDPIVFPLLEFEFNGILNTILKAIQITKGLNENAIRELNA